MSFRKLLELIGLFSGFAALILIMVVGDTFGFPGSTEYRTYLIFNRIMAVLLAIQTCSFTAIFLGNQEGMGRFEKKFLVIAIVAWATMAISTAAEFWLYSDLPYPETPADFNMRTAAFAFFCLGSLIGGFSLFVIGLRLYITNQVSLFIATVVILYLPLFIASFFIGLSIFVSPALAAIAIDVMAIRNKSKVGTGQT